MPALVWPGDEASHAASAAHQLRGTYAARTRLGHTPSWQTGQNMLEQLLRFKNDVERNEFPAKAA